MNCFCLQVVERMVTKTCMAERRRTIRVFEKKCLRKNLQDIREYRRQLPHETEGQRRMRMKLQPANDVVQSTRVDMNQANTGEIDSPEIERKTPDHAHRARIKIR
ncbi:hypothetical protein AX14_014247 [Amanita brunnescens Koide BX004]|nr:hypothetical protein AX14_014247 [Amanita brunnescens Koide BX004]